MALEKALHLAKKITCKKKVNKPQMGVYSRLLKSCLNTIYIYIFLKYIFLIFEIVNFFIFKLYLKPLLF